MLIVFVEVEWFVNSCFLIEVSLDVDDFEVLILNYFIIGRGIVNLLFGVFVDREILSYKCWC